MQNVNSSTYRQVRQFPVELGGQSLELITRPGMADWRDITPAMTLMAEHAPVQPGERVLVGPCGHGALGVWAARQAGPANVTCLDSHAVAAEMARATLDQNGMGEATVISDVPRHKDGPWDVFLLLLPKGRDLARLWLLNGALAMNPGGRIYIAGSNRGGIKSVIQDAQRLLGNGHVLSYKGGNRIATFVRPPALPDSLPPDFVQPGLLNGTLATFTVSLAGVERTIYTRPGVFSRNALDQGTRMLLDNLKVSSQERMLDLGCGYGVVGLYASLCATQGQVGLVDVDSLACECARETLARNGFPDAPVYQGDGLAAVPTEPLTLIASNPPFHSGHEVNLAMTTVFIDESYDALEKSGRLVLVANRFLVYEKLLQARFGRCEILERTPQYQVLSATRRN